MIVPRQFVGRMAWRVDDAYIKICLVGLRPAFIVPQRPLETFKGLGPVGYLVPWNGFVDEFELAMGLEV